MTNALKICMLLLSALLTGVVAHAQKDDNQEQIKALKVAFFTERLGLNAQEAAIF